MPTNSIKEYQVKKGNTYWTTNIVYLPVKVIVFSIDGEIVTTDKGKIHISNLYRNESDCPQR